MLSGTAIGEMKRIVDDDGAGTLTIEGEGFTAQIDSGDEYEIWQIPDAGVGVVDSSGSATDVVDATKSEADIDAVDFWQHYYMIPISGGQRGRIARVTSCVAATGTFVVGSGFTAALTAGDVFLLRRYVEVGNFDPGFAQEYLPRPMNRVNFATADGTIGAQGSGQLSFEVQIAGSGSVVGNAATPDPTPLDALIECVGLAKVIGTGTLATAGGSTTSVEITTGTHERFEIGQMIIHKGNATFITDKTDGAGGDDVLTVAPPLPVAATAADLISPTRMYKKTITADVRGCVIDWALDGIRHTFFGCKGNVEFVDGP